MDQFEAVKAKEKEQAEELEAARGEARAATGVTLSGVAEVALDLLRLGRLVRAPRSGPLLPASCIYGGTVVQLERSDTSIGHKSNCGDFGGLPDALQTPSMRCGRSGITCSRRHLSTCRDK